MPNTNLETAGMKAFKKWRKKGLIDNDDFEYLKESFGYNKAGNLNNDDFASIKELYLLKHQGTVEFEEFKIIKELYLQKIKGSIQTNNNESGEILPKYDIIRLYKFRLQERIAINEFLERKKEIFRLKGLGLTSDELQELNEFDNQVEIGNFSLDDFSSILELYRERSKGYIFVEELDSIKELYKQKIKGSIPDEVIVSGDNIPKYDFVRLFKLKLKDRISNDEFESFVERFKQHRECLLMNGIIDDDEIQEMFENSKDLDLLFYLIENRNKNE